jgi:hypothetical protein
MFESLKAIKNNLLKIKVETKNTSQNTSELLKLL